MEKEEIKKKVSEWIDKYHASMIEDLERVFNEQSSIFEDMANEDVDLARVIILALLREETYKFSPEHKNSTELVLRDIIFLSLRHGRVYTSAEIR